ncbi:glycosyltransferase family 4 protein [Cellulophaga sp. 20_2_10]|uniref:glycosyltransferase family 4 protein n=1 Tax=Cellulophaga sp. 20_2_10 TaxID=2942476 RepID=UPI00201B049B|nr:glycosyltransferase family 4 protein [Cellulophaga sp. 20_2_10]MCL5244790.1 glycosyltransferase family 4 protein [Cellulophaga sp. 20_2_10]
MKKKLIRVTTIPNSLGKLLTGQLSYMSTYYDVIGVSSGGSALEDVRKQEGVPVIAVELTRKITPLKDLKSVYGLYKIFKKEKPFIVHSHTPKAGTAAMLAAKLAGVPHRLHTIAGLPLLEATGTKRTILNLVEKITYACATKIYPNSFGLQDIIIKEKFTRKDKLKVIGKGSSNGIDTNHFNPDLYSAADNLKLRTELGFAAEDIVFTFVGRLVADKGINELLLAFKKLAALKKNVKLLLVGTFETELDPLNKASLDYIYNNDTVIGIGWQEDVRPYFAISDALTFPSYREGFPNVVMQAGAMKLYSIVTDINGCNEIIQEGINGTIIPVKDADALYTKMLQFYEQKDSLYSPETCRTIMINNYERAYIWEQLHKEYSSLEK